MLKKIIAPLLLASFLMVAFLGFTAMSYGSDGRMQGGCPFSAAGASLCPQDAFAATMHHLSAYESFFSVSLDSIMAALVGALVFVILYVLVSPFYLLLLRPPARARPARYSPPLSSRTRKITHWLALLEHSPSLS